MLRDELLGYLLGALEPDQEQAVEQYLRSDPEARRELEILRRATTPLAADRAHLPSPDGLAQQTCRLIRVRAHSAKAVQFSTSNVSGWQFRDFLVAASILVVATLLLLPAIQRSRWQSRQLACANNLSSLGTALSEYGDRHGGFLPYVPSEGRLAVAGIYASLLHDQGFVSDSSMFLCPALKQTKPFRVPSLEELRRIPTDSPQFGVWIRTMGGNYGYVLGYMQNGRYHGTRNRSRARFPILSDQPPAITQLAALGSPPSALNSPNHGGGGQNVLFEDGHTEWITLCVAGHSGDNIFLNRHGRVGAGIGPHDAVLAASDVSPTPREF